MSARRLVLSCVMATILLAVLCYPEMLLSFPMIPCMIVVLVMIGVLLRLIDRRSKVLHVLMTDFQTELRKQDHLREQNAQLELQIQERLKERQRVAARDLDLPRENVPSLVDVECAVCLRFGPVVVIMPCGHGKTCAQCIQTIVDKLEIATCPVCRAVIEDCVRVFS
ncbi:hypothetical protein RvY_15140 [Ramazzottius varieornatus]|uniref:RING-type domain-containing protein n=1 Tax=Ramazzottius varieornatus TaxID=947166 RepID=A0A1D1VTW2_RAMVA|nr:hypothetical protein RvY_15140 [Ramazzottius varieornatus]